MIEPVLAPYVSELASLWPEPEPEVGTWREVDGTLAKIDLTGFTALTEQLAQRVDGGAEDLSGVIGGLFEHLIAAVLQAHGDVVQFGGDALTLWFSGDEHRSRALACIASLHRLVATHGRVSAAGRAVQLRMSAGVASGRLVVVLVGRSHHEVVLLGPLVTRVLQLESLAAAGTTAVDAPDSPEGHRVLRRHSAPIAAAVGIPRGAREHSTVRAPQRFLPPEIVAAIGATGGLAQHRVATVAFIGVTDFDAAIANGRIGDAAAAVTRTAELVDQAVDLFGVCWTATDSSPDGVVFLLFGGAPVAHADDAERVMRATLHILLSMDGEVVRAGLATGSVFAADVGHLRRRAYALLGDTVNQAARLMGRAAAGTALVDDVTRAASRVEFGARHSRTVAVKGKRVQIAVSELGAPEGRRIGNNDEPELTGRAAERALLQAAIAAVADGEPGRHLAISGPSGSGRTRLLVELHHEAIRHGVPAVWVSGDEFSAAQPYAAAASLLALVRERDADVWNNADAVGGRSLADAVEHAEVRHLRVAEALAQHPTAILVDNEGSLDPSTRNLIAAITRRVLDAPVLVATAGEEVAPTHPPADGAVEIRLDPMPVDAMRQLVVAACDSFLLPEQIEEIVDAAGGRPVVAVARARGGSGSTLDALITSQLDELPIEDLAALRQLSVCGARPSPALVDATVAEPWRLRTDGLRSFVVRAGPSVMLHGRLLRELLYRALPKVERRRLHSRCASALLSLGATNEFEIARHLSAAARWDDAYEMSRAAARSAAALGALAAAQSAWQQALGACRSAGRQVLPGEVAELVAVATERGALDDADDALHAWGGRLDADPALLWSAAKLAEQRGEYSTALRRARRLRHHAGSLAHLSLTLEALVHFRRGHMREAAARLREVLAIEDVSPEVKAQAHLQSEMVLFELGDPAAELHEAWAEEAFLSAGNVVGAARSRLNRSGRLIEHGDLGEAVALLNDCVTEFERHGSLLDLVIATYNRGLAAVRQGRFAAAVADQHTGVRLALGLGWSEGIGYHSLLAGQLAGEEDFGRAMTEFDRASAIFGALDADAWVLETEVRRAAVLLLHHRDRAAADCLDAVRQRTDRPDDPALDIALERLLGWLAFREGAYAEADELFQSALGRARRSGFLYEVALALWGLEQLATAQMKEPNREWRAERLALFGVAQVTDELRGLAP